MNIRLRRLQADWDAVRHAFQGHSHIRIAGTAGDPPQRYHVEYRVRGLEERSDGSVIPKAEHLAEISLLTSYPRQSPACRMLTPVFHPNIAPHAICIGDDWSAGESLVQLIVRIGEMIAFQSYNIKSPLNGAAAQWVEEHLAELPIDKSPLTVVAQPRAAPAATPSPPAPPYVAPQAAVQSPPAFGPSSPFAPSPFTPGFFPGVPIANMPSASFGGAAPYAGPSVNPVPQAPFAAPANPAFVGPSRPAPPPPPPPVNSERAGSGPLAMAECDGCGQFTDESSIWTCGGRHAICRDCTIACLSCGGPICPRCTPAQCERCGA